MTKDELRAALRAEPASIQPEPHFVALLAARALAGTVVPAPRRSLVSIAAATGGVVLVVGGIATAATQIGGDGSREPSRPPATQPTTDKDAPDQTPPPATEDGASDGSPAASVGEPGTLGEVPRSSGSARDADEPSGAPTHGLADESGPALDEDDASGSGQTGSDEDPDDDPADDGTGEDEGSSETDAAASDGAGDDLLAADGAIEG